MSPAWQAQRLAARPTAQLWRIALGVLVIGTTYFLWMVATGVALWLVLGSAGFESELARIGAGADPWALVLLLSTFLGGWLGVWLTLRLLHRRPLGAALGRAPVVLRDFVTGILAMVLVGGGLTLAMAPMMPALVLTPDLAEWLWFLPLALVGVLIQTGAEEAVFRGYLQQHLAARFASPLVWLGGPTVLFGLAHFNPEGAGGNVWLVVAATGLFGLIAGDLTARSGSLGLAWGLHFANNVLALLVVSVSGTLDGMALLHLPDGVLTDDVLRPLLLADMVLMVAVWLACRLWLRRR